MTSDLALSRGYFMDDSSIIGLIGTVVGAVLGFCGGLVLERTRQEADKKKTKTEKIHELISALDEYRSQFEKHLLSPKEIDEPSHNKMLGIAQVYFPELMLPIVALNSAAWRYREGVHTDKKIYKERVEAYRAALENLDDKIIKLLYK